MNYPNTFLFRSTFKRFFRQSSSDGGYYGKVDGEKVVFLNASDGGKRDNGGMYYSRQEVINNLENKSWAIYKPKKKVVKTETIKKIVKPDNFPNKFYVHHSSFGDFGDNRNRYFIQVEGQATSFVSEKGIEKSAGWSREAVVENINKGVWMIRKDTYPYKFTAFDKNGHKFLHNYAPFRNDIPFYIQVDGEDVTYVYDDGVIQKSLTLTRYSTADYLTSGSYKGKEDTGASKLQEDQNKIQKLAEQLKALKNEDVLKVFELAGLKLQIDWSIKR